MTELQEVAKHARQCQIERDNIDMKLSIARAALERIYENSSTLSDAVQVAKQALLKLDKSNVSPERIISAPVETPKKNEPLDDPWSRSTPPPKKRKERNDKGKSRGSYGKPLF